MEKSERLVKSTPLAGLEELGSELRHSSTQVQTSNYLLCNLLILRISTYHSWLQTTAVMQFLYTYLKNTLTAQIDVNIVTSSYHEVASVQNVYHQPNALLITQYSFCFSI